MSHEALYRLSADMPELLWLRPKTIDKAHLLEALSQALNWPDYFGANWDAAWDCLSDPALMQAEARLGLHLATEALVDQDDLRSFLELIEEAAVLWQEQDALLQMFIYHQRSDLALLEPIPLWLNTQA